MLAFKYFREDYDSYLDYLLGDDRLLMKTKIDRIDKMYFVKSILRQMAEDQRTTPEQENRLVSRQEILKDKLLIELIENPKKLWKHLNVKVRNTWISRIILSRRLKCFLNSNDKLLTLEGEDFKDYFVKLINRSLFKGEHWDILKSFLISEAMVCKNWLSLSRSYKSLERNAFKTFFYSCFAISEVSETEKKKTRNNQKGRIKIRSLDDF